VGCHGSAALMGGCDGALLVVPVLTDGTASAAAALSASVRTWNTHLSRFLVCLCACSSQICILSSASIIMLSIPSRFHNLVRILLKTLKSLSQDAELAEMERIHLARWMKGGGSRPRKQNWS
jgi:hypothetical protein